MAGSYLRIDVDDSIALAALDRLSAIDVDKSPLFRDVGESLLISHHQRFDQQVDPTGRTWVPLNDRYRARKKPNADKILIWHGNLKGTLAYNADRDSLTFGSPLVYAAAQQFGKDHLPPRPFIGLSKSDDEMLLAKTGRFIEKTIGGAA
jgi:phage virion morphogenesis protein